MAGIALRLTYARKASGMTLQQVHERTGLGVSSISEWENGAREPSFAQLSLMARVYKRNSTFFLEEGGLPVDVVLWREKPADAQADSIELELIRLAEQFHRLEQVCGNPELCRLTIVSGSAKKFSFAEAERLAHDFRNSHSLGERPASSLLSTLEEICRVKVFHLPFEPSGTAACSLSDRFGAAVLLNSNNIRWRRNFDLAHELFHLLTWNIFRQGEYLKKVSDKEEQCANKFASNLLMPQEPLRLAIASQRDGKNVLDYDDLFEIARQFDVSVPALVWRLKDIGIIDREKAENVCNAIKGNISSWENRKNDNPPTRPVRYEALAIEAIKKGLISTGKFAQYMGMSRAAAMKLIEDEISAIRKDGIDAQIEIADP